MMKAPTNGGQTPKSHWTFFFETAQMNQVALARSGV
jgi:hypothetical protein